jgi:hypothetical protein
LVGTALFILAAGHGGLPVGYEISKKVEMISGLAPNGDS